MLADITKTVHSELQYDNFKCGVFCGEQEVITN